MKKFFLLILAAISLAVGQSWATQGYPTITNGGQYSQNVDATVDFSGAISGTGAVDDSGAINANGFVGVQFKVVKTNYRGTYKIQGSWDNINWSTIHETSLDTAGVTETYYWQCFQGWSYYRIEGGPNASNAGTVTTTAKLICPLNKSVPRFTGYYGHNARALEILPSALRSSSTSAYAYVSGSGIEVDVNATATSSGSLTITVSNVSDTGVAVSKVTSTPITSVSGYAGNRTLIVAPTIAAVNNVAAAGTGNRWLINCDEGGTSTTYSVTVRPIPTGNFPIASQP